MTIHHVFANRSNAGDWLSARGIQQALAPLTLREHRCDEPFVPATIHALEQAGPGDFIIIGGGGLFLDYFTPFWAAFEPISRRVPFCLWGVGCCSVRRADSLPARSLLEPIVARSRLCFVRDELTRSLFPTVSLPPPVPCPSLLTVSELPLPSTRRILHVDHHDVVGATVFERMEMIIGEFALRTGRQHARCNNLIRDGDEAALGALLQYYADADIVVSSRLHGCILGLATGRPVIAVSGDAKIDSFMATAGLADWVCAAEDVEQLPARLARIEEQRPPTAFLARARAANRAIAATMREAVARSA